MVKLLDDETDCTPVATNTGWDRETLVPSPKTPEVLLPVAHRAPSAFKKKAEDPVAKTEATEAGGLVVPPVEGPEGPDGEPAPGATGGADGLAHEKSTLATARQNRGET